MEPDEKEYYDRRRDQVRRAQKTHRERKATYVKSLEVEVAELRKRDAVLVRESTANQNLVQQLQATLTSEGLPLPINSTATSQSAHDLACFSIGGGAFPNQMLQVCYPSCDSDTAVAHSTGLNHPQVVANFVLSLEQPCIYHHPVPSSEPIVSDNLRSSGHSSMLSSSVLDGAPFFNLNPMKVGYPPAAEWYTSTVELEQLLQTSQQLGLDVEVTPIQAWGYLRQHSKFDLLTNEHLECLGAHLLPLVTCYGFGAVIHRPEFEKILGHLFDAL